MNFVLLSTQFTLIYILIIIKGRLALKEDLDTGYYWRGYYGDIPDDALPGGKDKRGKTTYIGQTLHGTCASGIVVTGHIYEAEKVMKYEWGYRQQIAKNNVQILCTHHPEQFEWIETNSTEIYNITGRHLICGGREKNYTVYIGRIVRDGEIEIGKVLVTNLDYMDGLYTALNGTYLHVHDSFSILAYNPDTTTQATMFNSKLQSYLSGGTLAAVNSGFLPSPIILSFCIYFIITCISL